MRRRLLRAGPVVLALAFPALLFPVGGPALSYAEGGIAPSRLSPAPVPKGAVRLGTVAPEDVLHLSVALKPRHPGALASLAQAVSDPGSGQYRHYLAPGEFAQRFGADPAAVAVLARDLRAKGLSVGPMTANGLDLPVSGRADQVEAALSVNLERFRLASGRVAYANPGSPVVPGSQAGLVQAVAGLNDLAVPRAGVVSLPPARSEGPSASPTPRASATGPSPCLAASVSGAATADELARAYGFSGLYAQNDLGAGQTVAVLEVADFSNADISTYQSCYATSAPVGRRLVDGGSPVGTNTLEATDDIEDVIGLAPAASVAAYIGPDTQVGFLDVINAMVSDDTAKVLSISFGVCEALASTSDLSAEHNAFAQAAVQGQSVLAATGDTGSEGCDNPGYPPSSQNVLSVNDPASQPMVTAVGGTQFSSYGPPPNESVWNTGVGASGGGISTQWAMPTWQTGPGVIGPYSSGTPCNAGSGLCRQVPDVSALSGSPYYSFYCTAGDCSGAGWTRRVGGTSFSTPLWAALLALVNASCPSAGTLGFANPALYQGASNVPGLFNDVTLGNNDYTGTNGGAYPAATGYDMATGLGSPVATPPAGSTSAHGLAAYLCGLAQATYHPLAPTRVVDTRPGSGQGDAGMTLGPGGVLNVVLAGKAGIPTTGVSAVVLNVTATDPTQPGFLSVYPTGASPPVASNLNFEPGQNVPNLVEAVLGSGSAVSVFNHSGSTDVVIDVEGYVATGGNGSGLFNPLPPARLADTRNPGASGSPGTLGPGGVLDVSVDGSGGVPATGVSAVVLNVTATGPAQAGYLTAFPSGTSLPLASNVNYRAGQVVANRVVVPVGSNGKVSIYSSATTDVVVDVTGWFTASSSTAGGAGFVGTTPTRIADTRTSSGLAYSGQTLGPGRVLKVMVAGVGGVPTTGVTAVVANVTVTNTTASGYLSVFPGTGTTPATSDLNWVAGQTTSNLVVVGLGSDGTIGIYNASGSTDVVVDVEGWYSTG
ncbi:MAG: protease pro-enzyme activation domain-containing protein [Acidimicrobiales bacterium]